MKKKILIAMLLCSAGFRYAGAQEYEETYTPVKKVLVEEYTGTWCGNCPRGYVAMEWIAKDYAGRHVAVSYHIDDQMSAADVYFFGVRAVPVGAIDRGGLIDPYYGTPGVPNDLGIYSDIDKALSEEAVCGIDIEVVEEEESAVVIPHIRFVKDEERSNYQMGYVLKSNGFNFPFWSQSNYYAGAVDAFKGTPLEEVANWPANKRGLEFKDVAIDVTGYKGMARSIPASVSKDTEYTPSFTIDFSNEKMAMHRPTMSVVVFVIDKSSGKILNADEYSFASEDENSVDEVTAETEVTSTVYYDISGNRVAVPSFGMYIKVERLANGSIRSSKIVIAPR